MGLFDKLRNSEDGEEVELRPPGNIRQPDNDRSKRSRNIRPRSSEEDEVALTDVKNATEQRSREKDEDDSGSDEFLLPGMNSSKDTNDGSADTGKRAGRKKQTGSGKTPDQHTMNIIQEQNKRIIELLEQLVDGNTEEDSEPDFSDAAIW